MILSIQPPMIKPKIFHGKNIHADTEEDTNIFPTILEDQEN